MGDPDAEVSAFTTPAVMGYVEEAISELVFGGATASGGAGEGPAPQRQKRGAAAAEETAERNHEAQRSEADVAGVVREDPLQVLELPIQVLYASTIRTCVCHTHRAFTGAQSDFAKCLVKSVSYSNVRICF